MLTLIGQTIYYDGQAVAWLTIPNGSLRGSVEAALNDLPDVTPLREALDLFDEAKGLTQLAVRAEHVAMTLETWLRQNRDHITETLL